MGDADRPGRFLSGLSEVVLRVDDLETMESFYRDVVGLETWQRSDGLVFFKVAELASPLGEGGHPQLLALVDRRQNPWPWRGLAYRDIDPGRSSLDHLAFEIHEEAFEPERERLEGLGLEVNTVEFPHMAARGLFFEDPEGNVIELLCHDSELETE